MHTTNKLPLYGFNNLTKNLSLSLYKVNYLTDDTTQSNYNKKINDLYNSSTLESWLIKIAQAIGGNVLNVASQDYNPQGASVTLLISEEAKPESLVAHLDKSHICIHTYPEEKPQAGIAIFRADIELSTCGVISPLKILNYVIAEFSADVIDIDFRVRGMTRDTGGKKYFNDSHIDNLSSYLNVVTKTQYQIVDSRSQINNVFHTSLMRKEITLKNHLLENLTPNSTKENIIDLAMPNSDIKNKIEHQIRKELLQLFNKVST